MKLFLKIWPGLLLLALSVIVSLQIYQHYGLSSDEHGQSLIGERFYQYVFESDPDFHNYIERDHGAGFELPLTILAKKLNISDPRDIFLMRHIVSHLFFLLCMFAGYLLALKIFKNQWLACLAFVMLVMHPRIYAHSYFNSKDVPAMGTFMLAIALSYWAFLKKNPLLFLLVGIVCGYSASIRLMNVIILGPMFILFLFDLVTAIRSRQNIWLPLANPLMVLAGCGITLYICWPTLWGDPVNNLLESYASLSKFRWFGNVWFAGSEIEAKYVPWSYIPTWFMLTTPEIWVLFGILGMILLIADLVNTPRAFFTNADQQFFLFLLLCFVAPIATIIILESTVYDDWRHLYFIYPAFVFLALYCIHRLAKRKFRIAIIALCVAEVIVVTRFMIKAHPFQGVYFNYFISHEQDYLQKKYELDYWGASNKAGLEWVLAHSGSDSIRINDAWILGFNLNILDPQQRKRFILAPEGQPIDFHIENFRTKPYKYQREHSVHNIDVLNSTVLRITKLR
jgi:hypothetical protein